MLTLFVHMRHNTYSGPIPSGQRLPVNLPSHITGACYDLIIVEESTAGQVAGVAGQFSADPHAAFSCL